MVLQWCKTDLRGILKNHLATWQFSGLCQFLDIYAGGLIELPKPSLQFRFEWKCNFWSLWIWLVLIFHQGDEALVGQRSDDLGNSLNGRNDLELMTGALGVSGTWRQTHPVYIFLSTFRWISRLYDGRIWKKGFGLAFGVGGTWRDLRSRIETQCFDWKALCSRSHLWPVAIDNHSIWASGNIMVCSPIKRRVASCWAALWKNSIT